MGVRLSEVYTPPSLSDKEKVCMKHFQTEEFLFPFDEANNGSVPSLIEKGLVTTHCALCIPTDAGRKVTQGLV